MARRIITPKGKSVRLEGLPELQAKISAIIDRSTGREVKKIHMGGALVLRDEARDLAPILQKPKKGRVAGLLRSAIFAAYGKESTPDVLVGVNYRIAPHAHWLEFGNVRIPAQPYMRPAITATRSKIVAVIAEGYRKLLIDGTSVGEPSSPGGAVPVPANPFGKTTSGNSGQSWQTGKS
jgi:HK97 gp10 family phage protein